MKPLAMLALILLTGCAAKKSHVTQYAPPECVRMKPAGDCPLTPQGGLDSKTCKVQYEILCVKVKEK